jgi:lipopolysaccharide biosynthesis glycosyltransferase
MNPLRIFIGYDKEELPAYHVLSHSILKRSSIPVSITPVAKHQLTDIYTRKRGEYESTDFSISRFLVPYLSTYSGLSIFMDCDMLCLADIAELVNLRRGQKAVWVVKHEYTPKTETKFLGRVQTNYQRKNWSSLMLFANASCAALTPKYVNKAIGLDLHWFQWLDDDGRIGELPLEWNWLVGEYKPNPKAKILHYTLGGPWFKETRDCDHADLWWREASEIGIKP